MRASFLGSLNGRGYVFVTEKSRIDRPGLFIETSPARVFSVDRGLLITGKTTAQAVYFTAITPGVVID